MSYFQVKVSFLRQQNDGTIKKESEQYLVDAMSFTETEARVIREMGESVRELYIDSVARSPIQEVVSYGDTDLWFKCKVVYRIMDETTEKEKKNTLYILVNANDVNEAYDRCKDHLKSMLVPFEIPKVEETAICEIYQYEKPVDSRYKKLDAVIHEIVSREPRVGGKVDAQAYKLTSELLQRREDVKLLFRDKEKYAAAISSAIKTIQREMEETGETSPIKAVLSISKKQELEPVYGSVLLAAAADMIDPPKAG
jgi:hypothetical protein